MTRESLTEVVAKYGGPVPVYDEERQARWERINTIRTAIDSGEYEAPTVINRRQKIVLGIAGLGIAALAAGGGVYTSMAPTRPEPVPACHVVEVDPTTPATFDPAGAIISAQSRQLEQQLPQFHRFVCETTTTR